MNPEAVDPTSDALIITGGSTVEVVVVDVEISKEWGLDMRNTQ